MRRFSSALCACTVAFAIVASSISAPAISQDDKMARPPQGPEATFYRDINFQGPAVFVSGPNPNLGLAWRVNSIRVKSGRWELCEQTNYRGPCRTYDRDTIMLGSPLRGRQVQSIRPTGWNGSPGEPGSNQSLRGMAAQFYPAPAQNGYRVLACRSQSANASCAAETADRFCASMGWRASARQSLETVRGRVYLADVLCSNTGY